jgi:tetratricopeptide (TPR) repeat protein
LDKDQQISQEQSEEIERFLQLEMTEEERVTFLTRIQVDPELAEHLNEMQLLYVGVQEASLQQRLDGFHEEMPRDNTVKTPGASMFSLRPLLVAASIIIVFTVSAWWLFFRTESNQSIYTDFFSPDPGLISAMTTSDNYLFDRAMIDYKTGNYEAAISAWSKMQTSQPNNDTLNYFLASAFLATEQSAKAIGYLERVTNSGSSVFVKDTYWYLALAWIREGDVTKAISWLELSDHPKKDELLARLRK